MRTVAALCRELIPDRRADGALLAAFAAERSEVPFAELVRRHGPLVWATCRRLLPDPADAEDAFQATFLVLVRQAGRLKGRDTVGPWLHRVAVLTARNVRRKNARRLVRQRELPDELPTSSPDSDLKADIDAALLALPARLRDPIILCHLQGFTRREAAERLGCPEGTLSSWLDRGLAKLRVRLRDLDPVKVLGGPAVAVPLALTANTTKAAIASGVAAAAIPPAVSSLVEGVLHMLWIKKATAATFALCAVFALGVGVGLGTRPGSTGVAAQDGPPKAGPVPKPADNAKEIAELEARIRAREVFLEALDAALLKLKPARLEGKAATEEHDRLREHAAATAAGLQDLKKQLAKLKGEKPAPAKDAAGGYLVLTLAGEPDSPDYAVREVPAGGATGAAPPGKAPTGDPRASRPSSVNWHPEARGEVRTRDLETLATLLRRARADSSGPRAVHVVVKPPAIPATDIINMLRMCDEAGFPIVTFTGYVFTGGELTELKADQKGEVKGYKRYDATERRAKELADEIETGLKRL